MNIISYTYSPGWTSTTSWRWAAWSTTRTTTKRRASWWKSAASSKSSSLGWPSASSFSKPWPWSKTTSFSRSKRAKPSGIWFWSQNFFYNNLLPIDLSLIIKRKITVKDFFNRQYISGDNFKYALLRRKLTTIHHLDCFCHMIVAFIFHISHPFAQPRSTIYTNKILVIFIDGLLKLFIMCVYNFTNNDLHYLELALLCSVWFQNRKIFHEHVPLLHFGSTYWRWPL